MLNNHTLIFMQNFDQWIQESWKTKITFERKKKMEKLPGEGLWEWFKPIQKHSIMEEENEEKRMWGE